MTRGRALGLMFLSIWMGACTTQPADTTGALTTTTAPSTEVRWQEDEPLPDQLLDTQWQLIGGSVEGEPIGSGASLSEHPYIGFFEQEAVGGGTEIVFYGSFGCDGFSGFFFEDDGLAAGVVTVLECTSAERDYKRLLGAGFFATDTIELVADVLTLTGPDIEIRFKSR